MLIVVPKTRTKSKVNVCSFHKKHPRQRYAGCTCSSSYWNEPIEKDADREMIGCEADYDLDQIGNK
uniref:Uncharacterized protein n=1 Tax=viral metagenome TaxID=1070528 RepID=A0A6M3L8E3_9ZZZZ